MSDHGPREFRPLGSARGRGVTTSRWPLLTLVSASGVAPSAGGSIARIMAVCGYDVTSLRFAGVSDNALLQDLLAGNQVCVLLQG